MTVGLFLFLVSTISIGANWFVLFAAAISGDSLLSSLAFILQSLTVGAYLIVGVADDETMERKIFERRNRKK